MGAAENSLQITTPDPDDRAPLERVHLHVRLATLRRELGRRERLQREGLRLEREGAPRLLQHHGAAGQTGGHRPLPACVGAVRGLARRPPLSAIKCGVTVLNACR